MSFASTLTAVRFYTQLDPYYYTVDNRPLSDLNANDTALANELDRRTYALDVTGSGTPTANQAPSGWSVTANGTGDYTITHGLNGTNYVMTGSVFSSSGGTFCVYAQTSTSFSVKTFNLAGALTHLRFHARVTGY